MDCPNCGSRNDPAAKFCFNCGTPLAAADGRRVAPQGERPDASPAPGDRQGGPYWGEPAEPRAAGPSEQRRAADAPPAADQEGRPWGAPETRPVDAQRRDYGAPGGGFPPQWGAPGAPVVQEAPPRKRRSKWLVIPLSIVGLCLLLCLGLFVFSLTPAGQDAAEGVGTWAAETSTEAASEAGTE